MSPRATYRFQFHAEFPFARARELVDYLDALGISHVYASPITVAVPGSRHGYDVTDPTRVNPELGGETALRDLVAALRARGMGLIIDIVPNHMGIASDHNPWWTDVLRHGQASEYARFFDIDWSLPILLPILGSPLAEAVAEGAITLDRSGIEPMVIAHGTHRLPLRPDDHAALPEDGDSSGIAALLERQHYRLGWWREANDNLNWRRFFSINDLAGLRVEDDAVFEASHALYFRLWEQGLIDGVRIDHVDGLSDPEGYCRKLRARFDSLPRNEDAPAGPAYILVEKILAPGEHLSEDWQVDGTSGYDFMEEVSALIHDPAGQEPLTQLWHDFTGRPLSYEQEEVQARQDMLAWSFEGQLAACVAAFHELAQSSPETARFTPAMWRRAIQRLLWVFPVYRTYGTGSHAPPGDEAVRTRVREAAAHYTPPGEAEVGDAILDWLAGTGPGTASLAAEAVRRFQQLSAPIAAKAVEDTAFYRHAPLLSRLDVGFDAVRLSGTIAEFHDACLTRAERFPQGMLATATHDHKRGADVRTRLAVLSGIPQVWTERMQAWDRAAEGPDSGVASGDRYQLYQMAFGAWPDGLKHDDSEGLDAYADRLGQWQAKALREAKLRSSWEAPDEAYEARARTFIDRLLKPSGLAGEIAGFVDKTAGAALGNMLVQAGLRYTVPGMPDCYQGCELPDYSMVDPDNRRPVDYALRKAQLPVSRATHPKLALIAALLELRRAQADLFAMGRYSPARTCGSRAAHVLAFERRHENVVVRCAFAIRCADALLGSADPVPPGDWWEDTTIEFGFSGESIAADLFAQGPVSVVEVS